MSDNEEYDTESSDSGSDSDSDTYSEYSDTEESDTESESDTDEEDLIGDCTDEDILKEVPRKYWETPCLYFVLLYLPDLGRWVGKVGYSNRGIKARLAGLGTEYIVHRDRFYKDAIPRIIPVALAGGNDLERRESELKRKLKLEPIQRGFRTKTECSYDIPAISKAFPRDVLFRSSIVLMQRKICYNGVEL